MFLDIVTKNGSLFTNMMSAPIVTLLYNAMNFGRHCDSGVFDMFSSSSDRLSF
jgi:hypothetical protein